MNHSIDDTNPEQLESRRPYSLASLLPDILAGLIIGLVFIGQAAAFAAFMFSGELSPALSIGIPVALLAIVAMVLIVAWRSTYPSTVSAVQESGLAVIVVATAGVIGQMGEASLEAKMATAIAIYGGSTLFTAVVFWAMGRFRLGSFVYFLPHPVLAGFLAGTGWLLVEGGLTVVTGSHSISGMVQAMKAPESMGLWIPAFAFSVFFLLALRRFDHFLTAPIVLVATVVLFHAALWVNGISGEEARRMGWLTAEMQAGREGSLLSPSFLAQVDWSRVASLLPAFGSVALIHAIGMLLNATGLELATRREVDINAELRCTGLANLVVGGIGGPVGFLGLGVTLLGEKMGARSRIVGYVTGIVCLAGLLIAGTLIQVLPIFLMGGLLMYLGIELLYDWGWKIRHNLPWHEWSAVVAILAVIATVGFMEGMGLGLLLCVAFFIWNYSRIPVFRREASGATLRSLVDRSAEAQCRLDSMGEKLFVLELEGYLFFGTANGVFRKVTGRLDDGEKEKPQFVLLDFRQVKDLDSSAVTNLVKIHNRCTAIGASLIISGASKGICKRMELGGLGADAEVEAQYHPDMDHALEWCENVLLEEEDRTSIELVDFLQGVIAADRREARVEDLADYFETSALKADEVLARRGDRADEVFIVRSGRLGAFLIYDDGYRLRLRSMTSGTVVGEPAFYAGGQRSADLIAETETEIYRIKLETLEELERTDPQLALMVHHLLGHSLVNKLFSATGIIESLR